jgi:ATP phosphoribosyltransferase
MEPEPTLKLALPKGRIADKVVRLLALVGYGVDGVDRSYRPRCAAPGVDVKLLKPQNIPQLVALGRHDIGFAGHDWVVEQGAEVEELLDLGFDPVRIVAAVPKELAPRWRALGRPVVVATEYERLARAFCDRQGVEAVIVRTYGATEVFPPEDADVIIDNTASGETLRQNGLEVVESVLTSSTRLIAWPRLRAESPAKWRRVEDLLVLLRGVLLARKKVLLEMNCARDKLEALVKALPCMRAPTVAELHGDSGYAVKVAVDRDIVPTLVPKIRALGAQDIIEYALEKILP